MFYSKFSHVSQGTHIDTDTQIMSMMMMLVMVVMVVLVLVVVVVISRQQPLNKTKCLS
jgi:heme/copper-type cytochrome/quinol oxidase subunit 2